MFCLSALAGACGTNTGSGATPAATAQLTDQARAVALLSPDNPLPSRAETVALADAVAVASAKSGASPEGAALALLAAELRARSWRVDRSPADAHEAQELYRAAAAAFGPTADGCRASLRSALFTGELAQDAAVTYRALFITERVEAARGAPQACLDAFRVARAAAVAFRPEGDKLAALEKDADAAVLAARAAVPTAPATDAPSGSPAASSGAPASTQPGPIVAGDRDNLVVSPPESLISKGPAKITSIERFGSEEGARVVLHASAPIGFDVGTLGSDEKAGKDARIYLDLKGATAKGIAKEIEVGGALKRVRLGTQKNGTRVVLDLKGPLYKRIFYLPQPFRIVIDLSTRPAQREDKRAAGGDTGARDIRRVAIDPGHGGNDTGAVGPTGLKEKEVTLDIAHRVAPILARELKVETLLTRDTDAYVALDLRTARANAFHADLFVSIHCNASESGTARGVQTFYLDASRERDTTLEKIAARENAAAKGKHEGGDTADDADLSAILTNLDVGQMAARSRHFADLVHRSALASLAGRYEGTKDQGVKSAGFFVLVGADMPAVLFETSFISNPEDEGRLATADYRQKMADAVFNAIKAYKEGK